MTPAPTGQAGTVMEQLRASMPPTYTMRELRAKLGGTLVGDPEAVVGGVNSLELAAPDELAFAESAKYLERARQSRSAVLLVPPGFPALEGRTFLHVERPRVTFFQAIPLFHPPAVPSGRVHRQAVIASDAVLGQRVTVQECAVVRSQARIGEETVIESGAFIGERVVIGARCWIGPNVAVMHDCRLGDRLIIHAGTVIGADGFGFVWAEDRYLKIPQLGNVILEDDVELGANVCVDRATFGSTIVRRGTKVDNLVQIAHNNVIGEHVTMSGQVGLAGSVQVGRGVIFGGKVGVVDHVTIGDGARLAAASIVTKSVPAGGTVWGYPARDIQRAKRELAAMARLPQFMKDRRAAKKPRAARPSR